MSRRGRRDDMLFPFNEYEISRYVIPALDLRRPDKNQVKNGRMTSEACASVYFSDLSAFFRKKLPLALR
ncbi:MAG: hypothetical protein DBX45_01075 [Oscillospiraceae bacterium]|jgi:hypothetical protein|nr:MAG: hypothetical protein DBX45_01075 [Oscillospiraceae bacterium]